METWAASFFSSDSDSYLEIPRTVPSTNLSVTAPHPLRVSENRFSSMGQSTPLSTTALGLEATRGTQWRFRNRKGQQGCRAARGAARGHRAGIPRRRGRHVLADHAPEARGSRRSVFVRQPRSSGPDRRAPAGPALEGGGCGAGRAAGGGASYWGRG